MNQPPKKSPVNLMHEWIDQADRAADAARGNSIDQAANAGHGNRVETHQRQRSRISEAKVAETQTLTDLQPLAESLPKGPQPTPEQHRR